MPADVIGEIVSQLNVVDFTSASLVSRGWMAQFNTPDPEMMLSN
jgi:hypothetical protein